MLSDVAFEVLRQLERAIGEYGQSQQFKAELTQAMNALFSIQFRLDVPRGEYVWPEVLRDRMEQWEEMCVSETC